MASVDFFHSEGKFTVEYIDCSHSTMALVDIDIDLSKMTIKVEYLKRDFVSRVVSPGEVFSLRRRTVFRIVPADGCFVHVKSWKQNRKRKDAGSMGSRSVFPASYDDGLLLESLYPGCLVDFSPPKPERDSVEEALSGPSILEFCQSTLKSQKVFTSTTAIEEARKRFWSWIPARDLRLFRCSFWTLLEMTTVVILWREKVEAWTADEDNCAQPLFGALSSLLMCDWLSKLEPTELMDAENVLWKALVEMRLAPEALKELVTKVILEKDETLCERLLPTVDGAFIYLLENVYPDPTLKACIIEAEVQLADDDDLAPTDLHRKDIARSLVVASSRIDGYGLYAGELEIDSDVPILEILGEVIRYVSGVHEDSNYIYEMSVSLNSEACADMEKLYLDPRKNGSMGRWINSSCDFNCKVVQMKGNQGLPVLILYSARAIRPGEELCVAYGHDYFDRDPKLLCNCGSPNCSFKISGGTEPQNADTQDTSSVKGE